MIKRSFALLLIVSILISLCACGKVAKEEENQSGSAASIAMLADTEQYYGTAFGQGDIIDINVEISEEDWQTIKDNAEDEEYYSANITVNGTTVENVGFRTKGFSSLTSVANSESDRYGFKIKFDEYLDQSLNGVDTLVLNGCFSDPSYMREYLTYAASKYLECQTPNVSYSNLYINGELFGFYLCIESYGDSFVERYTDSEDTVLYKAESEKCTLLTSDDGAGFDIQYGDDKDYLNIKNLITILNDTTSENKDKLEKILDIDSVLKAIAVNTVMGNYDCYSGSKAHNYYLMYSNGKFSYIGWDYNMSIGGFPEDNGASVTTEISSTVYGVDISQRPLIKKLLAIEEYYQRYLEYVNTLTNYFSNFDTMVGDMADSIRENVKNDPSAFYTIDQFEENIILSDADLSKVQSKIPSGKVNRFDLQKPDGEESSALGNQSKRDSENQIRPSNGDMALPSRDGQVQRPNGGRGMPINPDAVSIVDYITQRIKNIQTQAAEDA